jgi:hypothetical protein
VGPPLAPAATFSTTPSLPGSSVNRPVYKGLGSLAPCVERVEPCGARPREPPVLCDLTELHLPWDPDPPTSFDVVGVLDPGVGVVNLLPLVAIAVDPLSELEKRVAPLYVVVEPTIRESQPLARADQVRVGADRPAVGQPYAPPPALFRTSVPPQGDAREGVPRLYVVQLKPL